MSFILYSLILLQSILRYIYDVYKFNLNRFLTNFNYYLILLLFFDSKYKITKQR